MAVEGSSRSLSPAAAADREDLAPAGSGSTGEERSSHLETETIGSQLTESRADNSRSFRSRISDQNREEYEVINNAVEDIEPTNTKLVIDITDGTQNSVNSKKDSNHPSTDELNILRETPQLISSKTARSGATKDHKGPQIQWISSLKICTHLCILWELLGCMD